MHWVVSEVPKAEPIALEELRSHLGALSTGDDARLQALLQAARMHVERVCQRALMPQKWRISWDAFPEGCLEIPGGLVRAIDSLTYVDVDGATQTIDPAAYQKDLDRQPARLHPLATASGWPSARTDQLNAVQVVAQVGYAKASDVPAPLRAAILLIAGDLNENREGAIVGMSHVENPAVKALLWPFRRVLP